MSSAAAQEVLTPEPTKNALVGRAAGIPNGVGGTLYPFAKGVSGNPGGRTKEFAECQRFAREMSKEALEKLGELMRRSDDERVITVACNSILDRAFGKPKEQKTDDSQQVRPNLSALPPDMLAQLRSIMSVLAGQAEGAPASEAKAQDVVLETDQAKP